MGTISKTSNGTYEVRYSIRNEKGRITQKKKRFKKKKQADEYLNKVIADIENETYIEELNISLEEYLEKWLEIHKTNIALTTYEGYKIKLKHVIRHLGHIPLQSLRAIHIRELYHTLSKEKNYSNNTIILIHRSLSKALSSAYKLDLIKHNPCEKVDVPKRVKHQAKVLELEEVTTLIDSLKETNIYIPTLLAVMLGLRRGEVLGLQWKDIDFETGLMHINNTVTRMSTVVEKDTKTSQSTRKLFIGEFMKEELRKEKIRQKSYRLLFGTKYHLNDYVCKHEDGIPFEPSTFSQTFKLKIKKLDITQVTFHELRHTNATLMLTAGISPKVASERLGHSTIKITMDLYTHFLDSANKEVAVKLDELIRK